MDALNLKGSKSTPDILFDPDTGALGMSGESYPENPFEFYRPVLSWLTRYLAVRGGAVVLNIRLSYLNTGSTKCMMDILDLLEEHFLAGRKASVNWYYDEENDRALETAEEFKEEVTLPFQIHPVAVQP